MPAGRESSDVRAGEGIGRTTALSPAAAPPTPKTAPAGWRVPCFVVKNFGKVKHELVLGTEKELEEHYELMQKTPGNGA